MPPRIVLVNPAEPREDRVQAAVSVLLGGGIVVLPTETVYGLAADALNGEAVARINPLKGKPQDSPALLLLSGLDQVTQVAGELPEPFDSLAAMFWPGPLTLVVPAADELPREVTGGCGTVGVRVPGLALPRRVAAALGRPITGVSANLHGDPPCRTASEVAGRFPQDVEMILDGGPTAGGLPSTVLDLTGSQPRVLREGMLPSSALKQFIPALC